MQLLRISVLGFFSLIGIVTSLANQSKVSPPKVIIDTDFNTIFDDGQVGAMAAQLFADGTIDLLGFTIASGNEWRDQEVAECLRAVERMGIEKQVKVYVGSQYPILHDLNDYLYEEALFGPPIDYVGAYTSSPPNPPSPPPAPNQLVPPPDGFATHTKPAKTDAVDFIIDTIHQFPHEVTILEIAPPTNLGLAIRKDPTIVPLIKQIVTMAGQIFVPGNAYLGNAEFNWWFDPEATQIVLRAKVPHFVIPLDCTNNVPLTQAVFDQIANHQPQTIVTKLFAQTFGPTISPNTFIFDTNALGYFIHPEFATNTRGIWIDIHNTFDANYGQSVPFTSNPFPAIPLLQESTVIFAIDTNAFYAFYVDLLTRPVPVQFVRPPPSHNDLDD
jgi:inosine-uridine nucleoside N-ribohydrolase